MQQSGEKIGRREFLGAAGAVGMMIIKPQSVRGTAANSAIRLGLLGCGNRGTHVATSFANNTRARVVALADLFQDQLDRGKRHFDSIAEKKGYAGIDPKLMFRGPRAYQALASCPEIDMVQISTPDIFHPEHLEAVVDSGKHVYCEKPAAVDVTGCKRVMQHRRQGAEPPQPGHRLPGSPRPSLRGIGAPGSGRRVGEDRLRGGVLSFDGRLLSAFPRTPRLSNGAFGLSSGTASSPAISSLTKAFTWLTSATGCWEHIPLKPLGTGGRQDQGRSRRLLGPLRCHLHLSQ